MTSLKKKLLPFEILVLAPNCWSGQWVNRQQLFSRLGCQHPVLYSTGGWFTWHRNLPCWENSSPLGEFLQHDNVWVDDSPRFLLHVPKFPLLDALVSRLQVRRWKRFLGAHGKGPLIVYIYHPMFLRYIKWLDADYIVYHAYDLYDHTPGWDDALENAEHELLRVSDLVIASSDQIANVLLKKVTRNIRILPNGANVAAFDNTIANLEAQPADLIDIPYPRLGWVGSLHAEVDYSLIFELANRRPAWNFVLIGQVTTHADARADAERTKCDSLPNVHFLGSKRIDEIPHYLSHMDVNLMIYRLSDHSWIKAIYPLKLHEYLAAGHPVVSANVPSVRPFSKVVRIADGIDDWQLAIAEALEGSGPGTRDERKAVAAENSWDHRSNMLNEWLTNLAVNGRRAP
jgi:glycosyltransferase involved in cell wall biosynthesis